MDFTSLSFIGRLTDDPELIQSSAGNPICKFNVASNRRVGKDAERTSYIPVTVFGKQAELCHQYLTKGREVRVQGEFETDKYVDKEGKNRTGFGCVVGLNGIVQFGTGGTLKQDSDSDEDDVPEEVSIRSAVREKTNSSIRDKINDRGGSIRGQTTRRR